MNNTKNMQSNYLHKKSQVKQWFEHRVDQTSTQKDHGLAFRQFCIDAEDLNQYPCADNGRWKPLQEAGLILELKVKMPCRDEVDKEPAEDLCWTTIERLTVSLNIVQLMCSSQTRNRTHQGESR